MEFPSVCSKGTLRSTALSSKNAERDPSWPAPLSARLEPTEAPAAPRASGRPLPGTLSLRRERRSSVLPRPGSREPVGHVMMEGRPGPRAGGDGDQPLSEGGLIGGPSPPSLEQENKKAGDCLFFKCNLVVFLSCWRHCLIRATAEKSALISV